MTTEEQREHVIQKISDMLRQNPFTFDFVVSKEPKGIKITYEVTQEEMNAIMKTSAEKHKEV